MLPPTEDITDSDDDIVASVNITIDVQANGQHYLTVEGPAKEEEYLIEDGVAGLKGRIAAELEKLHEFIGTADSVPADVVPEVHVPAEGEKHSPDAGVAKNKFDTIGEALADEEKRKG